MKFYDSILDWCRSFIGKPDATAAEIDNALSEQKQTLAEIMSGSGVEALTEQVNQMTERLNGFDAQLSDLTTQLQERDATIQALTEQLTASQTEINDRDEKITALNAQIEAANKSHNTQIAALSATIASLKAGTGVPKQENAPVNLPKEAAQDENKIVPIADKRLAGYLGLK